MILQLMKPHKILELIEWRETRHKSEKWRRRKTNDRRAKIKERYQGKTWDIDYVYQADNAADPNRQSTTVQRWRRTLPSRATFIFCQYPSGPRISTDISYLALILIAYVYSCLNSRHASPSISRIIKRQFLRALITRYRKLNGTFKLWYCNIIRVYTHI